MPRTTLALCLLGAGLAVVGCAGVPSEVTAGGGARGEGTLAARVVRAPISPVEGLPGRDDSAPAPGVSFKLTRLEGGGAEIAITNDRGEFRKRLAVGSWRVELSSDASVGFSKDLPRTVSVSAGHETQIDIRLDTGIR